MCRVALSGSRVAFGHVPQFGIAVQQGEEVEDVARVAACVLVAFHFAGQVDEYFSLSHTCFLAAVVRVAVSGKSAVSAASLDGRFVQVVLHLPGDGVGPDKELCGSGAFACCCRAFRRQHQQFRGAEVGGRRTEPAVHGHARAHRLARSVGRAELCDEVALVVHVRHKGKAPLLVGHRPGFQPSALSGVHLQT